MTDNRQLVPQDVLLNYEVHEWFNGLAILKHVHPNEWEDVIAVLRDFNLFETYIATGGGNKSKVSKHIDAFLYGRPAPWRETHFRTAIEVDGVKRETPTHSIDCFRNGVGLEIEWNSKDSIYDRDLNNFRLLYGLGVLEVGVIVTRSDELQQVFAQLGRHKSYGESTTHMRKLLPKVRGGGNGGCPLVVFGITKELFVPHSSGPISVEAAPPEPGDDE